MRTLLLVACGPTLVLCVLHVVFIVAAVRASHDARAMWDDVCTDAAATLRSRAEVHFAAVSDFVQPGAAWGPTNDPCRHLLHAPSSVAALHRVVNGTFSAGCVRTDGGALYSRVPASSSAPAPAGSAVLECRTDDPTAACVSGASGYTPAADITFMNGGNVRHLSADGQGWWARQSLRFAGECGPLAAAPSSAAADECFAFAQARQGGVLWLVFSRKALLDRDVFVRFPYRVLLPPDLLGVAPPAGVFQPSEEDLFESADAHCSVSLPALPLYELVVAAPSGARVEEQDEATAVVVTLLAVLFLPAALWFLTLILAARAELLRTAHELTGSVAAERASDVTLHFRRNEVTNEGAVLCSEEVFEISQSVCDLANKLNLYRPYIPEALAISLRHSEGGGCGGNGGNGAATAPKKLGQHPPLVVHSPTGTDFDLDMSTEDPTPNILRRNSAGGQRRANSFCINVGHSSSKSLLFSTPNRKDSDALDIPGVVQPLPGMARNRSEGDLTLRDAAAAASSRRSSGTSTGSCIRVVKMPLTRSTATISEIKHKKATLLYIEADLLRCQTVFVDQHTSMSSSFIRVVCDVTNHFEGVVLHLGPNYALATWNCHKSIPKHCLQACQASLDLSVQLDTMIKDRRISWSMGLASGLAYVGECGNFAHKTAMVMGEPVVMAKKLARLAPRVGARILANETVYDNVQALMYMRLVDSVLLPHETVRRGAGGDNFEGSFFRSEGDESEEEFTNEEADATLVYEFVSAHDRTPFKERIPEAYIVGFSMLRSHEFKNARDRFREYLTKNTWCYQAYRLLKIAALLKSQAGKTLTVPKPYYRREMTFELYEDRAASTECPRSVTPVAPPFKLMLSSSKRRLGDTSPTRRSMWGQDSAQLMRGIQEARGQPANMRQIGMAVRSVGKVRKLGRNPSSPPSHAQDLLQDASTRRGSDSVRSATNDSLNASRSLGNSLGLSASSQWDARNHMESASSMWDDTRYSTVGILSDELDPNLPPIEIKDKRGEKWYRSGKCLGRGAYGEVWLAMEEHGGLTALKTVRLPERGARSAQEDAANEAISEVGMLSQLRHENIVSYLSSTICGKYIAIVMEYMSGGSLADLIERFTHLPLSSSVRYLKDILRGLKFLHSQNIVHRDIKPHNVLLLIDGQCKLADFGASQHMQLVKGGEDIVGTPLYMAPEACRGHAVKASDIWGMRHQRDFALWIVFPPFYSSILYTQAWAS